MHRDVRKRVEEQEQTLTYGSQTDGSENAPLDAQGRGKFHIQWDSGLAMLTNGVVVSVCFVDFGDPVLGNPL